MAIISAGVIMNVVLGSAASSFVFMAHGDGTAAGRDRQVDSGSPAWKAVRDAGRPHG